MVINIKFEQTTILEKQIFSKFPEIAPCKLSLEAIFPSLYVAPRIIIQKSFCLWKKSASIQVKNVVYISVIGPSIIIGDIGRKTSRINTGFRYSSEFDQLGVRSWQNIGLSVLLSFGV